MNELYRVTISYPTPGESPSSRDRKIYTTIGETLEDARTKGVTAFQQTETYTNLLRGDASLLKVTATRVGPIKIGTPKLSFRDEEARFLVRPRISADGQSLEFIVTEKES